MQVKQAPIKLAPAAAETPARLPLVCATSRPVHSLDERRHAGRTVQVAPSTVAYLVVPASPTAALIAIHACGCRDRTSRQRACEPRQARTCEASCPPACVESSQALPVATQCGEH